MNVNESYLTPKEVASRWHWHQESVRRLLRARRLASIVIGRRRLVPVAEILRVEQSGFIACNTKTSQR